MTFKEAFLDLIGIACTKDASAAARSKLWWVPSQRGLFDSKSFYNVMV
jgi:hypothetical protein